ncbi:hypothetical protein [Methylobacterium haplocladii]|uniref:SMODS and SLOG-associating 2TM effector domain-containing protein n=1 Tax=Methylobacterium haplocladii TaxID=1176176 RepID=A0A512IU08_9HYPH|nr:hypothetical protein [Methylobacterium haplocladii]GEP01194.1 hypothetical protein MHA02_35810 [Methylobacterium haplocladii]GJD86331.1 hypothetical protein HPGCJGGD_4237 [Methylobacterium haplocladii]GLS61281.1 hypothetical protein GCM10007887_39810 [Methylobacterium haplocladii]
MRDQARSIDGETGARAVYGAERERPRLRLLSPLAEGSDRLVAEIALELGYELDVALPFARADYAKDFTDGASRAAFERFLGPDTAPAAYLALDGGRGDDEARSYEAVGRLVVRNCDLLIAVWDGRPAKGRGGTADIVRFSARFGPPIWWIDATAAAPVRFIQTPADLRSPDRAPQAEAAASLLAGMIRSVLLPPHSRRHQHSLIGRTLHALHGRGRRKPLRHDGHSEPQSDPNAAGTAGADDPLHAYLNDRQQPENPFWRLYGWGYRAIGGARTVPRPPPTPVPPGPSAYWEALYRPADRASTDYGNRYRSSYLWIFVLATLAVASAVLALAHEPIKLAATTVEILLLLAILGLVATNERRNWHGRWIACRLLAELCRKQGALAALGWSLPPPNLSRSLYAAVPEHAEHAPPEAWVGWYFGAALRAAPLPAGDLLGERLAAIREYLRVSLVQEQQLYHLDRRMRSRRVGRWLVQAGEYAFLATLILVVAKLVLVAASAGHGTGDHAHELHGLIVLLGSLAAVLPAVSAAFVGIRAYAELELLEQQSARMIRVMDAAGARIDALNLARPLASQDLAAEVFEVSSEMLQDVGGWADLFRVKAVEAG